MLCGFFVRGNEGVIVWRNKSMYMEKLASANGFVCAFGNIVAIKKDGFRPLSLCKGRLFNCTMVAVMTQ